MNKREEGKRNKIKSKAGIVKIKTPANEVSFLVSALSVSAVCFSRTCFFELKKKTRKSQKHYTNKKNKIKYRKRNTRT